MPRPTSDCRATERKHPWPMVRLGDVCEDKILRIKSIGEPNIAYIDIASIDNVQKRVVGVKEYDVEDAPGRAQQVVVPGDVLVSNVRPNLNAVAIVDVASAIPLIASTGFCVLRVKDTVLPEYVYYYVQTSDFIDPLVAVSEKASYPSVTDTIVKNSLIPLPPLSVQSEIVARLERELAAVEKMKKGFEALAETAKAEFKAELKEVFEEISRGGAYPPAEGCPRSGCPSRGETRRLGEIGRVAMCKRVLKAQTSENGDVPFFKIGTFGKEPNAYISNELFREFVKKFSYPKKGDVLISAAGTIGRTIVFDGKPSYFQDSNIVWLEHDGTKVTNEYLHCFYWSKPWKVSDGATIPRIYNGDIESVEIPLPSLPVQRQIVARLDAAKARAEKLEAKAREGVAVCETMRKAILKEAFEGG